MNIDSTGKYKYKKFNYQPVLVFSTLTAVLLSAFAVAWGGLAIGLALIALPFVVAYVYLVFNNPVAGMIGLYILNFFALGLTRYLADVPLGLTVDANLLLVYLSVIFKSYSQNIPWKNARNDLVLLAFVWFGYALFQLINPQVVSHEAWLYAVRGVALYMLLTIPLIFIVFNRKADLELFFRLWAVLSILGSLKGIMQKFIGFDPWEQVWLDEGGSLTHILRGKPRMFSFFSDAGQFGAAQGHAGIVFLILAYHLKSSKKLKIFYAITGLLAIYGMMISGTRGALAVPIMGFALYILLQKNLKAIIAGAVLGAIVIGFFVFTTIGNSSYTIYRMRSAFNLQDKSLQVRFENQRKLKTYLADKPFGGGIGSAGNWGKRFTPNTYLAKIPTDSWYVMIWAEQGIVGLTLHLLILFYILIKSSYIIMFRLKDPWNRAKMSALASGLFGIMVASYGNGVLGQMPTGLIIYSSMGFLFLARKYETSDLQPVSEAVKTTEK